MDTIIELMNSLAGFLADQMKHAASLTWYEFIRAVATALFSVFFIYIWIMVQAKPERTMPGHMKHFFKWLFAKT
ncbi:hypothetical protein [Aquitalea palustris]|uniref:hypothetical protein n=1 Tax=Aquitalea palustris TaxID=2480983 RepID=UPI001CF05C33|nr:hypothetical protein [Aquitalea palustris]